MTGELLQHAGGADQGADLRPPALGEHHFPPRHRDRGGSGRAETKRGGPAARSSDGVDSGDEPPGTAVVGGCEGRRAPAPEVEADEDFMVINPNGGGNRHPSGSRRRPRLWMPRLQHTRHPQKPTPSPSNDNQNQGERRSGRRQIQKPIRSSGFRFHDGTGDEPIPFVAPDQTLPSLPNPIRQITEL